MSTSFPMYPMPVGADGDIVPEAVSGGPRGVELLVNAMTGLFGAKAATGTWLGPSSDQELENWASYYNMLRLMYYNNRVYDELRTRAYDFGEKGRALQGLRNPINAGCKFYRAVLWPGSDLRQALPIDVPTGSSSAALIQQCADIVFAWSNWVRKKQIYATWLPELGDVILKLGTRPYNEKPERIFIEMIPPDYASDIKIDERGYLTHIRLTIPKVERTPMGTKTDWSIEVWDKDRQDVRYWFTEDRGKALKHTDNLGEPDETVSFETMGIDDFLPFKHSKFDDDGGERGVALAIPALDKVRELDGMATSLHSRIYRHNKPEYFLESIAIDRDGYLTVLSETIEEDMPDAMYLIGADKVTQVPPGWKMRDAVPNVNYDSQLEGITKHWEALRETDMPELNWYSLTQSGNDRSGEALMTLLKPAISKAWEARGVGEEDMVQMLQMAFTIAKKAGIAPFTGLGDFEAGGMVFTFRERDIIPLMEVEMTNIRAKRAEVTQMLLDLGADPQGAALVAGFSQQELALLKLPTQAELERRRQEALQQQQEGAEDEEDSGSGEDPEGDDDSGSGRNASEQSGAGGSG